MSRDRRAAPAGAAYRVRILALTAAVGTFLLTSRATSFAFSPSMRSDSDSLPNTSACATYLSQTGAGLPLEYVPPECRAAAGQPGVGMVQNAEPEARHLTSRHQSKLLETASGKGQAALGAFIKQQASSAHEQELEGGDYEDDAAYNDQIEADLEEEEAEEEEEEVEEEEEEPATAAQTKEGAKRIEQPGKGSASEDGALWAGHGSETAGGRGTFPPDMPFLQALSTCSTLECVRAAHQQPKEGVRFNFPHFFIIGFQKAATSSLFSHLCTHPFLRQSEGKEPQFFTDHCNSDPFQCPQNDTLFYLNTTLRLPEFLATKGRRGHFEGSTHYIRAGKELAVPLREMFPWLRVIISLREPISRAISMLVHNLEKHEEKTCLTHQPLYDCLMTKSQLRDMRKAGGPSGYEGPMRGWLETQPKEMMHFVQYEELTHPDDGQAVLRGVKEFLGVDTGLGRKELGLRNARRFTHQPEGHKLTRPHYEDLLVLARKDADTAISLLQQHGFLTQEAAGQWMQRWENHWQENLDRCDEDGNCVFQLS